MEARVLFLGHVIEAVNVLFFLLFLYPLNAEDLKT
jgi:hypothetical protein